MSIGPRGVPVVPAFGPGSAEKARPYYLPYASATQDGAITAAIYAKLATSTSAPTASALVERNAGGASAFVDVYTTSFNGNLVARQAADANGWRMDREPSGKRVWYQNWSVAAPASPEIVLVATINKPVALTNYSTVDVLFGWTNVGAGTSGTAPQRFIVIPRAMAGTSTVADIAGFSPTGSNMSVWMLTMYFFVKLVER